MPNSSADRNIECPRARLGRALWAVNWDCWGTFTFRGRVGRTQAREAFYGFYRGIRRNLGALVVFAVLERGTEGRRHIHMLAGESQDLRPEHLRAGWKAGISKVSLYDPSRGAAFYMAKAVHDREAEFLTSKGFVLPKTEDWTPRRRVEGAPDGSGDTMLAEDHRSRVVRLLGEA